MKAILHTGSNLGKRAENLATAVQYIEKQVGNILKISPIYETAAWGIENQADFLNQAIIIETSLSAEVLLQKVLAIEEEMGRVRKIKWGERLIDIDILFYESEVIDLPHLKIPHPFLQERNFVLAPLKDIAAEWIHPIFKKSCMELFAASKDPLEAKLWTKLENPY